MMTPRSRTRTRIGVGLLAGLALVPLVALQGASASAPPPPSAPDPAAVAAALAAPGPAIQVRKLINGDDADTAPGVLALPGLPLSVAIEVINTGNVRLDPIVVTDDTIAAADITCQGTALDPGQMLYCSASHPAPAPGVVHTNVVTATGTPPAEPDGTQPADVSDTDVAHAHVDDPAPAISVAKTFNDSRYEDPSATDAPPGLAVQAGTQMQVVIEVTNTGNVTLDPVTVTDDTIAAGDLDCSNGTLESRLDPGQVTTCVALVPTPAVGELHTNTATATGTPPAAPDGTPVPDVQASDTAYATGVDTGGARILVFKDINQDRADTAPGVEVPAGSLMRVQFVVQNRGSVALDPVVITDDTIAPDDIDCPATALAAGDAMTCTATLPAPAPGTVHTNVATATGTPPAAPDGTQPPPVTDTDRAFAYVGTISIEKSINGEDADANNDSVGVAPGEPMDVRMEVTNNGPVTLDPVVVTDDTIAAEDISCPQASLAAGASMTCTATHPGPGRQQYHHNTATATGTPPAAPDGTQPPDVADTDEAWAFGEPLSIVQTINGVDADDAPGVIVAEGSTLQFEFLVTNHAEFTYHTIRVRQTGTTSSPVTCPRAGLAGGESMTCTATGPAPEPGTVLRSYATAVGYWLVDSANPGDSDSDRDFAMVDATPGAPGIELVKAINGDDADDAPGVSVADGSTMSVTFLVTNTSGALLDPVVVRDDTIAPDAIRCPRLKLADGESMTCTASYPAPAVGVTHTNLATASGSPPYPGGGELFAPPDLVDADSANATTATGSSTTTTTTTTTSTTTPGGTGPSTSAPIGTTPASSTSTTTSTTTSSTTAPTGTTGPGTTDPSSPAVPTTATGGPAGSEPGQSSMPGPPTDVAPGRTSRGPAPLPRTGTDVTPLALLGVTLAAAGIVLHRLARRAQTA